MIDLMALLIIGVGLMNTYLYSWLWLYRGYRTNRRWIYLYLAIASLQWSALYAVGMTHAVWDVHLMPASGPVLFIREAALLTLAGTGAMALQEMRMR